VILLSPVAPTISPLSARYEPSLGNYGYDPATLYPEINYDTPASYGYESPQYEPSPSPPPSPSISSVPNEPHLATPEPLYENPYQGVTFVGNIAAESHQGHFRIQQYVNERWYSYVLEQISMAVTFY
jgi:hypothetical protein